MTVTSSVARNDYVGSGSVSSYDFTFEILAPTDLAVYIINTAGDTQTLAYGTDYTVTLNSATRIGTITLTAGALANLYKLAIVDNQPLTQLVDLEASNKYPPSTIERSFDHVAMQLRTLMEEIRHSVRFPLAENISGILSDSTARASKYLGFDPAGALALASPPASGGGSGGGSGGDGDGKQIATTETLRTLMTVSLLNGSFTEVTGSGEVGGSIPDGSVTMTIGNNSQTPGRVYCEGRAFMNSGQPMYMNGANTPWRSFNEFGSDGTHGNGVYDSAWWEAEFTRLEERGLNSTRIWINDDALGEGHVFSSTGELLSVTSLYWANIDDLLTRAAAHGIYLKLSVMSFDHFSWNNANSRNYHLMLGKESNVQSWIDQFIIPLADRHLANLHLFAIDLGNEVDNFFEDQATASMSDGTCTPVGGGSAVVNFGDRLDDYVVGQQLYVNGTNMGPVITRVSDTQCIATTGYPGASATFVTGNPEYDWGWLGKTPATYQRYVAMCAAAIHNRPTIAPLVTVGVQSIKYSTSAYGASDYYSNSALSSFTGDTASFIDFHSIHYYQWAEAFFPFALSPSAHGLSAIPATYGEMPAGWENMNGIFRNGGWVFKWWPRTYYGVDAIVHVDDGVNKRLYRCVTAGISGPVYGVAGADNGPSGTGTGIVDNAAVWDYCPNNSTFLGLTAYSAYQMVISYDLGVWVCTTAGTTANEGGPNGTPTTYTSGTAVFTYRRQAFVTEASVFSWLLANGWVGHYPWTSNGFGYNGGLYEVDLFYAPAPNVVVNWLPATAYAQNAKVYNDTGKIYRALTAGTSAGSGGPTGTGASIADNTVTWCYVKTVATPPWTTYGLAADAFSVAHDALVFPDDSAPWSNVGSVIRQSKARAWVEPGGMVQHRLTFELSAGQSNMSQAVGPYDQTDGIILVAVGATNALEIRMIKASVITSISRSTWSVDAFDGTGPSDINLDLTKPQTLVVEISPTGMRPNRVGFLIDDTVSWAHEFAAGNVDAVYPAVSSLPAHWQIWSGGAVAAAATMSAFDATARSSDGPRAMKKVAFNGGFVSTYCSSSSIVELAALRIALGSRRVATMVPLAIAILGASTGGSYLFEWWIEINPTESVPTTWSTVPGSLVEWTRLRAIAAQGSRVAGGYGFNSIQSVLENMDELLSHSLTEGDVLSIQVRNVAVDPNYFWFALDWEEG